MIKVGITGGIGSGKSTVCRIFEKEFGIPIYYADIRAKYLMNFDLKLKTEIKKHFGNVYHRNGRINRPVLAQKIFNDKKLLKTLNGLVHPAVYEDGLNWFQSFESEKTYAIKEAALLYESKSAAQLDKIIVVHVEDEERIRRVMKRDRITKKQVLARIKNQMPQEEKMRQADYLINNKNREDLLTQVKNIHLALMHLEK